MLYIITELTDPLTTLIRDDPVRPEIPLKQRINPFASVFVWRDSLNFEPLAVTCVAFREFVPNSVVELSTIPQALPTAAVFYSIWSYRPGAGRTLIRAAADHIRSKFPHVQQLVTLSPSTEMARQFHLRNGATVFRVNSDSVNYLYSIPALGDSLKN